MILCKRTGELCSMCIIGQVKRDQCPYRMVTEDDTTETQIEGQITMDEVMDKTKQNDSSGGA